MTGYRSPTDEWGTPATTRDLTGGLCIGVPTFTELDPVVQYRACLACPVRDLCPTSTPWPKGEACRKGHRTGKDGKFANGTCKACSRIRNAAEAAKKAQTSPLPPTVPDIRRDELLEFIREQRSLGFEWSLIVDDLGTTLQALYRRLYRYGEREMAAALRANTSLAENRQDRERRIRAERRVA